MKIHQLSGILFLIILSSLLALAGCSKDEDSTPTGPQDGSTTETIDPEAGGSVTYQDATVDIPPDALDAATDVSVGVTTSAPAFSQPTGTAKVGATYEFGPAGTTFSLLVTVTLQYNPADLGSYDESSVNLMSYANADETPVELSNVIVDAANNEVSGQTTHFSYFILVVSTGPGPGGDLPPPSGGDPQGLWNLDYLIFETDDPMPDSLQIDITASGTGSLDVGASDWEIDENRELVIHTVYTFMGLSYEYYDTTQVVEHSWGTYSVDGVYIIATTTGSETDPDAIGDVDSLLFTAESDRLIVYTTTTYDAYTYDIFTVYTH